MIELGVADWKLRRMSEMLSDLRKSDHCFKDDNTCVVISVHVGEFVCACVSRCVCVY